jgi:hypothetical protein
MSPHALIVVWVFSALTSWTLTPKDPGSMGVMEQARRTVTQEVIDVAYDPTEAPLFKGPDGRARTAILLGVIATLETRLAAHVRQGRCKTGECDPNGSGGHDAVGLMQIHVGEDGILLTQKGYRRCSRRDASCLHESDLIRHEEVAIRLALHMVRQSGLASYCGEPVEGPVTQRRKNVLEAWLTKHPAPVADDAYLSDTETASK